MKKLLILLVFGLGLVQAQIKTHAVQYFYFYADSTQNAKGSCYFDASISKDTVILDILPPNAPLVLVVAERFLPEPFEDGEILIMNAIDNEGIHCQIKLFISPTYREIHLIYSNAEFGYIFEN